MCMEYFPFKMQQLERNPTLFKNRFVESKFKFSFHQLKNLFLIDLGEDNPINDDDPVVASESTESIHQSSGSSSSVEVTATTAASNTLNASTSANTGHNIIDGNNKFSSKYM